MLSGKIEKEIKQEYKIIGNFTFRQVICLVIATAVILVIKFVSRLDIFSLLMPIVIVAWLAWLFGWKEKNGQHAEVFLLKEIQKSIYKNKKRNYRTLNSYVTMFNKEYSAMRATDLANKQTAKQFKKEQKAAAKKVSRLKGFL